MRHILLLLTLTVTSQVQAADGKLLATPGISQIEGAGGGGFVPWAQLAGYGSRDEIAANMFCSVANVNDYDLQVCGAQATFYDRVEFSVAKQKFHVDALNLDIKQRVLGVKARLYGDVVYSRFPQISLGIQHKKLDDPTVAYLLGADEDSGADIYLAASKLHLGAIGGYNWLWNITARSTEANQTGLLGFGNAERGNQREIVLEASSAILFGRHVALGVEYRQKPDNLGLKEDDWSNVFIAWFPNKVISLTAAWLDLGEIAGAKNQKGAYFSVTGYY
ncbi:DUF3034 family protein [Methylophaga sp.]|uniref:DUF3034 family protein n=1 Tax=Methylophaga sp. TaxID=2024840 RepID=UPI0027226768|nr:DUF3034 family protein [Methylophaga sp.]MDO8826410.1 DUF3034 family protein [Methylophaga sp.]